MINPMPKPLVIDLFAGRFGWGRAFAAEGWRVIGFDIEHQAYHGPVPDGCELVLQDVLTLHGSQFRDAACIVASPPCQAYSYMAMPWKRAKELAAWRRADVERIYDLNELFDACFRIQRQASEAAGRHIPLVVENVKSAQPWVGPARAHFGSYYLWGDVDSVGGRIVAGGVRFGQTLRARRMAKVGGYSAPSFRGMAWNDAAAYALGTKPWPEEGTKAAEGMKTIATKNDGGSWFDVAHNTESGTGRNPVNGDGVKQPGHSGRGWFADPDVAGHFSSKSDSRKAASAQIAEIPFALARYIARSFYPTAENSVMQ